MKNKIITLLAAVSLLVAAVNAQATPYYVGALANSSTGGAGLATISLTAGEAFTVTVNPLDLWNAGDLPRWSNANGLAGNLFSTGAIDVTGDSSGTSLGTLIGVNFGVWNQNGFSAPYGALVGKIGADYLLLGTSFAGFAPVSGTLDLFYWDSYPSDNTGGVIAEVNAAPVPEPGTMMLLGAGFFGLALLGKRRKNA